LFTSLVVQPRHTCERSKMLGKIAIISSVSATAAFAACSGSADPVAGICYEGDSDALGVKATVKLNVKSWISHGVGVGTFDLTGVGVQSFSCASHQFGKMGRTFMTDLSDCLPSGVTVPSIQYCSDSDTIAVKVQYSVAPVPITATLKKVSCSDSYENDFTSCSGTADPAGAGCYEGKAGALGLKEDVKVELKAFAGGKGTIDLNGGGIVPFTCADHSFTKSGQEISVNVSDCVPAGITISDVKYCSDSDQIKVTVKDKSVPIPISALLSKIACSSNMSATLIV